MKEVEENIPPFVLQVVVVAVEDQVEDVEEMGKVGGLEEVKNNTLLSCVPVVVVVENEVENVKVMEEVEEVGENLSLSACR